MYTVDLLDMPAISVPVDTVVFPRCRSTAPKPPVLQVKFGQRGRGLRRRHGREWQPAGPNPRQGRLQGGRPPQDVPHQQRVHPQGVECPKALGDQALPSTKKTNVKL